MNNAAKSGQNVQEGPLGMEHPVDERPDPGRDLLLAQQSVEYLRAHGVDHGAVIQCLRDEFEIDLATAEMIAGERETGYREASAG